MATRRLEVDFIFDDSRARAGFARTGRNVSLLEQRFGRMGLVASRSLGVAASSVSRLGSAARTAAPYIGVGLAVGIGKSVEAASDLEEAINKANETFEKSAPR